MPKSARARSLARASVPPASTTSWATGPASKAASRSPDVAAEVAGRLVAVPARAIASSRSRRLPPATLAKIRRFRSTGMNGVVVRQQRLGLAQEQEAAVVQGEVEPVEDPGLGLGVEVHQGVAAGQQVDPRDRRVLDQVVAAEDHRAAEVLVEDVAAVASARSTSPGARAGRLRPPWRRTWPGGPGSGPPRRRRWRRSSPGRGRRRRPAASARTMARRVRLLARGAAGTPDAGSGRPAACSPASRGMTSSAIVSQAGGSRKKPVTLIRIVSKSRANSSGWTSR